MNIQSKIDHSIKLLKKAESLALMMQPETGYYLAFSGGKDSQCIYHLAKMAGVKFHAVYNVTTLDPPHSCISYETITRTWSSTARNAIFGRFARIKEYYQPCE